MRGASLSSPVGCFTAAIDIVRWEACCIARVLITALLLSIPVGGLPLRYLLRRISFRVEGMCV